MWGGKSHMNINRRCNGKHSDRSLRGAPSCNAFLQSTTVLTSDLVIMNSCVASKG